MEPLLQSSQGSSGGSQGSHLPLVAYQRLSQSMSGSLAVPACDPFLAVAVCELSRDPCSSWPIRRAFCVESCRARCYSLQFG